MSDMTQILSELNDRSREVFRRVVEGYLDNGEPVGSRTLTRTMTEKVSAATIRNVMQDLEHLGLINSPHISAGRIPTEQGLRMFVDGLLEMDDLDSTDRDVAGKALIRVQRAENPGPVARPAGIFESSVERLVRL